MAGERMAGKIVKGSMWISAARLITNILAATSTLVLAAYLTPDDFGIVAIGTTILMIVTATTELSLSQALVRHKDPTVGHFNTAWSLNALRGVLLVIIMIASAYPIARAYEDNRLVWIIFSLAFSVLIGSLTNPRRIMLERSLVFWQEFLLTVSQKLSGSLVSIFIAITYQSYWSLVVGTIIGQVVNVAVSYMAVPFKPKFSLMHARELFNFSGWLTAAQVINTLNWRFDYLLVGKVLGTVNLGQYSVGSNLAMLPTRETIAPLTLTIFPAFASIADDRPRLRAAYQKGQAILSAVALPAGFGMILIAEPLVRAVMGPRWAVAVFVIQALSGIFALQTLGQFAQPLGMALGHTKLLFFRDIQLFVVRIGVILSATLLYGLNGLIIARVMTGLLAIIFNLYLVRRFLEITIVDQLKVNWRAIVSTAIMMAGTSFLLTGTFQAADKWTAYCSIAARMLLSIAIYFIAMFGMWLASGKPAGPEAEIRKLTESFALRFKRSKLV
jgi:O-antigen/teichoic acid export membrane protein